MLQRVANRLLLSFLLIFLCALPAWASVEIEAGEGLDKVIVPGVSVTISGEDASDTNKGIASFSSSDFTVTAGAVAIKASTYQPYDADLSTYATLTPSANAQTLLGQTYPQMASSMGALTNSAAFAPSYTSTTANYFLASPSGGAGTPTFRAIVDADIPNNITIDVSGSATTAAYASSSGSATTATYATSSGTATTANYASSSGTATTATYASTSGSATTATYATSSGSATTATYASTGPFAPSYSSITQSYGLFSPSGGAGTPTFRVIALADLPSTTKDKHLRFTIIDPNTAYGKSATLCLIPVLDAAITVTSITVTTSSASYEVLGDLKWADAYIGLGNATLVNDFDTTSGVRTDTSIASASVASGKCVYISFDSAPSASMTTVSFDITFNY
jgi:hypothetical protein